MITDESKHVLAYTDERIIYFEDICYWEAINGLFMGTYEQWLACGGKSDEGVKL